jgi:hypothetical protein
VTKFTPPQRNLKWDFHCSNRDERENDKDFTERKQRERKGKPAAVKEDSESNEFIFVSKRTEEN